MIKLFVTGDNHIGLDYKSHKEPQILHDERINAFKGMVDKANEENCDFFVITGDLFENISQVSKSDVSEVVKYLALFSNTVLVLPGNHDYYANGEEAVWKFFKAEISSKHNILLLSEENELHFNIRDEEIVFYPAVCNSRHSADNKLQWIKDKKINADSVYRIGVAHGAIEGVAIDSEGQYFKMEKSELEAIPVDVWLIGHAHVQYPSAITYEYSSVGRIFNAGTHVQRDVHNNTEGVCYILEIAGGNGQKDVKAKKWQSSRLRFYRPDPIIIATGNKLEDTLIEALKNYGDFSSVEIKVKGAVDDAEYDRRADIVESVLKRFTESEYDISGITRIITKAFIDKEFPDTELSNKILSSLIDDPAEAQMVYNVFMDIK